MDENLAGFQSKKFSAARARRMRNLEILSLRTTSNSSFGFGGPYPRTANSNSKSNAISEYAHGRTRLSDLKLAAAMFARFIGRTDKEYASGPRYSFFEGNGRVIFRQKLPPLRITRVYRDYLGAVLAGIESDPDLPIPSVRQMLRESSAWRDRIQELRASRRFILILKVAAMMLIPTAILLIALAFLFR